MALKTQKKSNFGESISDKIRNRAKEIWQKRGNAPGDALSDWLEAEKQIKSELRK